MKDKTVKDHLRVAAEMFNVDPDLVISGSGVFARAARASVILNARKSGHSYAKIGRVMRRHRSTIREIYNKYEEGWR